MNLLLDTTIQIDRITGSKERKQAIENVLKGNQLYCTTYVLGEYFNNIVSDFVTLYGLFLIDKDFAETGKRINERIFGRSQARVQKLFANILALCSYDLNEVEDSFCLYVDLLQDEFYHGLVKVMDETKCVRAKNKVLYEEGIPTITSVSCRKTHKVCEVCQLWKESETAVEQLLTEKKVSGKLLDILLAAKKDEMEYSGNNCKTLGDIVISLEALKEEVGVCSSNKKDFQPICDSVGVQFVAPDYTWKNK